MRQEEGFIEHIGIIRTCVRVQICRIYLRKPSQKKKRMNILCTALNDFDGLTLNQPVAPGGIQQFSLLQ